VVRADADAHREYQERTRPLRKVLWWTGVALSAAIGLAVGFLWSFAVGIPLACLLALAWLPAFLRLDKTMQIRRFPELAGDDVVWRRKHFP
jgi:hypothetical protein